MFKQKLARKWGHAIAGGWAALLLDRSRDFVVPPSSVGGNPAPPHDSQGVDEPATPGRYHHFHGHTGPCARPVPPPIAQPAASAALDFLSPPEGIFRLPVSILIPPPRGPNQNPSSAGGTSCHRVIIFTTL